jgi:hypothetical protein
MLLSQNARKGKHSVSKCRSELGDRLLTEMSLVRPYKLLGYMSSDVFYSNSDSITNCIQMINRKENGTCGYANRTQMD